MPDEEETEVQRIPCSGKGWNLHLRDKSKGVNSPCIICGSTDDNTYAKDDAHA